jgi:hypothetical protein
MATLEPLDKLLVMLVAPHKPLATRQLLDQPMATLEPLDKPLAMQHQPPSEKELSHKAAMILCNEGRKTKSQIQSYTGRGIWRMPNYRANQTFPTIPIEVLVSPTPITSRTITDV